MGYRIVGDVSHFSPYTNGTAAPLWWGFIGMIAIEATVFATLIASWFYLAYGSTEWPQGNIEPPHLLLPTVNTVVLVASSLALHWADTGIRKGDQRRLTIGMVVATLLAATFLVLKVVEYGQVEYRWDTNAYGSIVWTIIGFHSTHVLALLLKSVVTTVLAVRHYFSRERRLGVEVNGIYWHFVTAVWIPLYFVLYWTPRLL